MPILHGRTNFALCEVATLYTAANTVIALTAGEGAKLPSPASDGAFPLTWWDSTTFTDPALDPNREVVWCGSRAGDTLVVSRGAESALGGGAASTKATSGSTYKLALSATAGLFTRVDSHFQVREVAENLRIVCDSPAALTVLADRLSVQGRLFTTVSQVLNITNSGPGGRTVTEAASMWFAVWAIANDQGSLSVIGDSSFTSPTLPGGYDLKRRVGAVRNDGAGDFLTFRQIGPHVQYVENEDVVRVLTAGGAATFTTVSLAPVVPPPVQYVQLGSILEITHNATGVIFDLYVRPTSAVPVTSVQILSRVVPVVVGVLHSARDQAWWLVSSAQQVDYRVTQAAATTTAAYLDVLGYYDPAGAA